MTLAVTHTQYTWHPPAQSAHSSSCASCKVPFSSASPRCSTCRRPRQAAHFGNKLSPGDNPFWQRPPIPCPVLQLLTEMLTQSDPPPLFPPLLSLCIFNFIQTPGSHTDPEPVLVYFQCCSVFYLFLFLYIIFFTNCLISIGELQSLSLGSCCDMILFNMHFINILCQQRNLSQWNQRVIRHVNAPVWRFIIRTQSTCLINTCMTHGDLMF